MTWCMIVSELATHTAQLHIHMLHPLNYYPYYHKNSTTLSISSMLSISTQTSSYKKHLTPSKRLTSVYKYISVVRVSSVVSRLTEKGVTSRAPFKVASSLLGVIQFNNLTREDVWILTSKR